MTLELRHWREQDAKALGRAVTESLEHLRPWMPWAADEPLSLEARVALIRGWERDRRAGGDEVMGIWLDGAPVGGTGLHRRIGEGGLEIGYWVHVRYTRRGIATEVVRRLCAQAFADPAIRRVEVHHDVANAVSGGVPDKLGFAYAGEEPRAVQAPGELGVQRIWRLTREAWESAQSGSPWRATTRS